MHQNKIM